MKKVIISKDGTVINIIEIEENANYSVDPDFTLVDYGPGAEIDGTFIDGKFTPPIRIPNPLNVRRQELKSKFREQTATFDEVQEFLSNHI